MMTGLVHLNVIVFVAITVALRGEVWGETSINQLWWQWKDFCYINGHARRQG
jgi:hypothetical protein